MKIETNYLGQVDYSQEDIITFNNGLYGFEKKQEFILVNLEDPEFPFEWLQSINNKDLSFVVTSPFLFYEPYDFEIPDEIVDSLNIKNSKDILVLSMVVLNDDLEKSTMNLQAPIIINKESKKGRQIILKEDYDIKYKFLLKKESN